jgi:hypothetical protein
MYASLGHASVNLREEFVKDISALITSLQDQVTISNSVWMRMKLLDPVPEWTGL